MQKTTCCNFRFDCEKHNPIRDDGYCMNCGYHPEIKILSNQLKSHQKQIFKQKEIIENLEIAVELWKQLYDEQQCEIIELFRKYDPSAIGE